QIGTAAQSEIRAIAVPPGDLPGQPQLLRSPNGLDQSPFVLVDTSDNVWVFWNTVTGDGGIWYRRFLRATMAWEVAEGIQVPGTSAAGVQAPITAVSDADGGIWLFWVRFTITAANLWYTRYSPVMQIWNNPRQLTGYPGTEAEPFVLRGPDS